MRTKLVLIAPEGPRTPILDPLKARILTAAAKSEGGCWEWIGALDGHGYGRVRNHERRTEGAHRVSYRVFVGPIPEGLVIDHLCRNRRCVNPKHLEAVTLEENKRRGESPAAINARKTHCFRGHEFTPENTHYSPAGGRACRACNRIEKRQMKAQEINAEPARYCEAPNCSNEIPRGSRVDRKTCSPSCRTRRGRQVTWAVAA